MDCMDRTQKTVYLDDDQIDRLGGSAEENDSSFNEEVRKLWISLSIGTTRLAVIRLPA